MLKQIMDFQNKHLLSKNEMEHCTFLKITRKNKNQCCYQIKIQK